MSQNYFLIFLKQQWLSRCTYHICWLQATRINSTGLIFILVDVGALLSVLVESKFFQCSATWINTIEISMNSTLSVSIVIPPASSSILSTISRNLIPGTKNEISERTVGIRGNVAYVSKQSKRSAHNSRVRIMSLWLQVVYLVQSNSKFTNRVTETMFGVIPGAVKIDKAIHSLLDHCLSPTGCSLVAIYIKGAWTVWVDC